MSTTYSFIDAKVQKTNEIRKNTTDYIAFILHLISGL